MSWGLRSSSRFVRRLNKNLIRTPFCTKMHTKLSLLFISNNKYNIYVFKNSGRKKILFFIFWKRRIFLFGHVQMVCNWYSLWYKIHLRSAILWFDTNLMIGVKIILVAQYILLILTKPSFYLYGIFQKKRGKRFKTKILRTKILWEVRMWYPKI